MTSTIWTRTFDTLVSAAAQAPSFNEIFPDRNDDPVRSF